MTYSVDTDYKKHFKYTQTVEGIERQNSHNGTIYRNIKGRTRRHLSAGDRDTDASQVPWDARSWVDVIIMLGLSAGMSVEGIAVY